MNYCKLVTVSVEDHLGSVELRNSVGALWPFLSDPERKLVYELDMADESDERHGVIFVPYTFVLDRDLTIYKVYNGWWYLGRPTVEDLRIDLRALMSRREDWEYRKK